jgi:hypothetical protein
MRKESGDMASLISGLSVKIQGLTGTEDAPVTKALDEIRTLMSGLNDHVKTVSETLTRLSEEA